MQQIINCPSCQRKLQVPEALLGQDVQCPTCGATFNATDNPRPTSPPGGPLAPPYDPDRPPIPRADSGRYDDYDDYGDLDRSRRQRRDLLPHRGNTILVLGILSFVVCPFLGPVAWIMGNQDLAEIRAGRMDPEGEGTTSAGRVCAMIATIYALVVIGLMCMGFLMAIATGGR